MRCRDRWAGKPRYGDCLSVRMSSEAQWERREVFAGTVLCALSYAFMLAGCVAPPGPVRGAASDEPAEGTREAPVEQRPRLAGVAGQRFVFVNQARWLGGSWSVSGVEANPPDPMRLCFRVGPPAAAVMAPGAPQPEPTQASESGVFDGVPQGMGGPILLAEVGHERVELVGLNARRLSARGASNLSCREIFSPANSSEEDPAGVWPFADGIDFVTLGSLPAESFSPGVEYVIELSGCAEGLPAGTPFCELSNAYNGASNLVLRAVPLCANVV